MPTISANQLSKELGISKAVISKLESIKDCHDGEIGDVPPCNASTLKLYHDHFGCSYEFLMGETDCKTPEYYSMGKDPIFSLFDDSFIKKSANVSDSDQMFEDTDYLYQTRYY